MKPLVEFPDPERAIIDYFDSAYIGAIAARKPDTIDTKPPQTVMPAGTEWLQVTVDGSVSADYPVTERATVRCVYWTAPGKRSDAKAGASLAHGLLARHPGDDDVWGTRPLIGRSQVLVDPDTKNLMVWFTFRVNLRPLKVTV